MSYKFDLRLAVCLVGVISAILVSEASAQSWINPGHGNWSVAANWDGGEPNASSTMTYINNGGTVDITQAAEVCNRLQMGTDVGTSGTVHMGSGDLTVYGYETIGAYGTGIFDQTGGAHNIGMTLALSSLDGGYGTFNLSGGELSVGDDVTVGGLGTGQFIQSGGAHTCRSLYLGYGVGSNGVYELTGGSLTINRGYSVSPTGIMVGPGSTVGTFRLGNAVGTGLIQETGSGTDGVSLSLNSYATGAATFEGWGTVGLTGDLGTNGRVIANGYGTDRTLDLARFSSITNGHDNNTDNGWFARNHGRLVLPSVSLAVGNPSYSWGESDYDTTIDLVNSVRMNFNNVSSSGDLNIDLLAADHGDVPDAGDLSFLGVWDFNPSMELAFQSVDLTFRYDDDLASTLGVSENSLRVYHYVNDNWVDITSDIDTMAHRISAHDVTTFSVFAVGTVPEPSSVQLLSMGVVGLGLYRWRKR